LALEFTNTKLDFGPGYRIYFGKDGEILVILLGWGPRSVSSETLTTQLPDGKTTNTGKSERNPNAINQRFQRNNPRAGTA
jgi:hypothetical protein